MWGSPVLVAPLGTSAYAWKALTNYTYTTLLDNIRGKSLPQSAMLERESAAPVGWLRTSAPGTLTHTRALVSHSWLTTIFSVRLPLVKSIYRVFQSSNYRSSRA